MNNIKLIELITEFNFVNVFGEIVIFTDKLGTETCTEMTSLESSKVKPAVINYKKKEEYGNVYFNEGKYYAIVKGTINNT